MAEKFRKVEKEIWDELSLKVEKKTFERKLEHFELEQGNLDKKFTKEIQIMREVQDRIRRKTEEQNIHLNELRQEQDAKMSSKEGQKLWANFKKYAQYDELKDLYRKTLPAISSFEDKLQANNAHNERVDAMLRRLDEIICTKSDRSALKDFRDLVESHYISREENKNTAQHTELRICEFQSRVDEMETLLKFQARQL